MIKNERQYRITRAQLETFKEALQALENHGQQYEAPSELLQIQREALQSQEAELREDIERYERLQSGNEYLLENASLQDFPNVLIAARIARGLTQKDLGDRMGLKEQQIQRWESNGYATTTFSRIAEVVSALGLHVREEIFVPSQNFTFRELINNLKTIGLRSSVLLKRILPSQATLVAAEADHEQYSGLLFNTANIVARIFGLPLAHVLSGQPGQFDLTALAAGRFKMPANATEESSSAYTLYAHYLAVLVTQCTRELGSVTIPKDWTEVHAKLCGNGRQDGLSWERTLSYVWSLGIPVLPLRDPGAFHGAVWVIGNRPIIVLKQTKQWISMWLFDLLHELGHILQQSVTNGIERFEVIETHPISQSRRESPEEDAANEFAEDVLLHGRSAEIEKRCVAVARGNTRNLKNSIPQVAAEEGIHQGVLANHMAYRLGQQNQDWWSTATNLQPKDEMPYEIAREMLFAKIRIHELNQTDRDILLRACTDDLTSEEQSHG